MSTDVDRKTYIGGDGKVDFRLKADPTVGLQVKARHGDLETARWSISREEVEENAVLVCVLIQEEVHRSRPKEQYSCVFAGFLPTNLIKISRHSGSVGIKDLLYGGGLYCYLDGMSKRKQCKKVSLIPFHRPIVATGKLQPVATSGNRVEQMWQRVLCHLQPPTTRDLVQQQCCLLSFDIDNGTACVGINSSKLYELNKSKVPALEQAFEKALHRMVNVTLKVTSVTKPGTIATVSPVALTRKTEAI
jgi:hypothetical protein